MGGVCCREKLVDKKKEKNEKNESDVERELDVIFCATKLHYPHVKTVASYYPTTKPSYYLNQPISRRGFSTRYTVGTRYLFLVKGLIQ